MAFTVAPVQGIELAAAVRRLVAHEPDPPGNAARCCELLLAGELDAAGLFAAHDAAGTLRGVVLVQPLPGALGLAWPPRADRDAIADALAAAGCAWLRSRGVKVCQAFTADGDAVDALCRAGFRRIAQVLHLSCTVDPLAEPEPTALPFTLLEYAPTLHERFHRTLLATSEGSRDCPELNGDRTPDELLEAFGQPMPGSWLLASAEGADIGLLMLDRGRDSHTVELAYLGLTPAARGRGCGAALLRFALAHARRSGCTSLTLSVDSRNDPALRLYRRFGFAERDRQDVYLALWPQLATS